MPDDNERTVRFMYDVPILADALVKNEDGTLELTEDGREAAYDFLMEGISDRKGGWYPRHYILCDEDFMAGQACDRELGHDGPHQEYDA